VVPCDDLKLHLSNLASYPEANPAQEGPGCPPEPPFSEALRSDSCIRAAPSQARALCFRQTLPWLYQEIGSGQAPAGYNPGFRFKHIDKAYRKTISAIAGGV
jgi:hypothetical protein